MIRSGDTVRKKDGKARIARPEWVAPMTVFHRVALMLLYAMHGEAAAAIEPALLTRTPKEFQKRKAIPRRAVTEARSLAQWPGLPDEFAGADQKIVDPLVGQTGKAVHDTGRAVTMLYQQRCTARR